MQECGHKGCRIQAEVGEDERCLSRVRHIRFTRGAHLRAVRLNREEECIINNAGSFCRADPSRHLVAQGFPKGLDRSRKRAYLGDRIGSRPRDPARLFNWLRLNAHSFGE